MKATIDVINSIFTPVKVGNQTYYSFKFGDRQQYELAVEPTLVNGVLEIALYEDGELIPDQKLAVKAVMREQLNGQAKLAN